MPRLRLGGVLGVLAVTACAVIALPERATAEPPTEQPADATFDPPGPRSLRPLGADLTAGIIGHSVEGRPLQIGCVGSGSEMLLLVGGMHMGAEEITARLVHELGWLASIGALDVPDATQLCLIPVLNPDGLVRDQRTNANDVDLNRNWPTSDWSTEARAHEHRVSGGDRPLSEPETRALFRYIGNERPAAVIAWHCCAALVEANHTLLAAELGRRYATSAGLAYVTEWTQYPISGQLLDAMDRLGVTTLDVELASEHVLPLIAHSNAVEDVLRAMAHASKPGSTLVQGLTWIDRGRETDMSLATPLTALERLRRSVGDGSLLD